METFSKVSNLTPYAPPAADEPLKKLPMARSHCATPTS